MPSPGALGAFAALAFALVGTARTWFAGSPPRLERLGAGGGLARIGLGVQLAFVGRKD